MVGRLFARYLPPVRSVTRTIWFVLLMLLVTALASRATTAQTGPAVINWVRVVDLDEGVLRSPLGLAYSPYVDAFYLVEKGAAEGETGATTISTLTAYGQRLGSVTLAVPPTHSLNLTYDSRWRRLLLWDASRNELLSVGERTDGALDPGSLMRYPAAAWGVQQAVGMAFDIAQGHLYLLDGVGPRLLRIEPAGDGGLAGAAVTALALPAFPQVQGMAYEPASGHLHMVAWGTQTLYEVTLNGEVVAMRSLAEFAFGGVGGLAFAPSSDLTDDPQQGHLYFADYGRALRPTAPQTPSLGWDVYLPLLAAGTSPGTSSDSMEQSPQYGQVVELSLVETAQPQAQAAAITLTFIQTVDTSQWSPPSPDPSGIAYIPASNTLLAGDGEVDEMALYAGANMWHITPAGAVVSTWATLPFSDEPVGLALNPANGRLFASDDTGTRSVYEVDPGADGIYGNGNDVITSFNTSPFNSKDPEGVEYAGDLGALFIADGVNREIYRVAPGANGRFDGVPPTGDDQVTHFDTLSLGLDDPEGIAYNPSNGHLYAVGKPASTLFELTTEGVLVQTLSISAANARKPAGLAVGPNSRNPGEMSIYIVARGVDNDSNPNENDGKVYEFALGQPAGATPTATPTPTDTPTPTAGPSSTPTDTPTSTDTPLPTDTPTVTPTPTNPPPFSTLTLVAAADAEVRQDAPNTNYGTKTRLNVDSPNEESYLRFVVSGVTGTVQRATLRLFATNGSSNGPSLYRTGNSWSETGITWSNRPAPTSGVIANVDSIPSNVWVEYDVTSLIAGDGTYDLVFLPDSTKGVAFSSREGSAPPQLVVEFVTGPTSTPAASTPTSTPTSTNTPVSGAAVFVGAGDIADCTGTADEATALLLDGIPGSVFTAGDNAYPADTATAFNDCYGPSWGRHSSRTRPAVGDAEYAQPGATGYFTYFGAAAGAPNAGYYSYDVGSWHIIVLNSNCSQIGGCDPASPQGQWLQADLAARPTTCSLAIFHEPVFSSKGGDLDLRDFWIPLYNAGVDIVLNGHYHFYERFAAQNPDGVAEPGRGIREFVVGTGGRSLSSFSENPPNSEVRNNTTYGVLKLTLNPTSYDWEFIPVAGMTFTDSGSAPCVTP
ncbi:MAG: DNRLRE domain-containing protein [Caldilineaceae bacterium]|nr:DNRLRE domain-containing protein [Caldilineaceae bacterium]